MQFQEALISEQYFTKTTHDFSVSISDKAGAGDAADYRVNAAAAAGLAPAVFRQR